MGDQTLRKLERHLLASPSLETRARYLRECLRSDTLGSDVVELAGYCGDEAALQAIGEPGPHDLEAIDPHLWLRGLQAWGCEFLCQALILWCREQFGEPRNSLRREAWQLLDLWWNSPSKEGYEAFSELVDYTLRSWNRDYFQEQWLLPVNLILQDLEVFCDDEQQQLRSILYTMEEYFSPTASSAFAFPVDVIQLRRLLLDEVFHEPLLSVKLRRDLAEAPRFVERIIDTITPPLRRRIVEKMRALEQNMAELVYQDGQELQLLIGSCSYENVRSSPFLMSIAEVIEVRPVDRAGETEDL